MTLVETLTQQHQLIIELAEKLDGSIRAQDAFQTVRAVGELKRAVVKHLVLEDQQLYPELVRSATQRGDPSASVRAYTYAAEMAQISSALLTFLIRCEHSSPLAELGEKWPAMRQILLDRIASEESTLYPMYSRLAAPAPAVG
jgi:hemerythrin superfamily protein